MLGFSHAPELLVLFIIAFMVFGPEKLPELARGAGRGLREFRRMSSELQGSLGSTFQEPLAPMLAASPTSRSSIPGPHPSSGRRPICHRRRRPRPPWPPSTRQRLRPNTTAARRLASLM